MRATNSVWVASLLLFFVACGPDGRDNPGNCPGICSSLGFQECNDGVYSDPVACGPDQVCDPNAGCVVCPPDELYCFGDTSNEVWRCNHDGTGGTHVETCDADSVCSGGECKTPCEAAADNPSNLGCDFWAADLDNESSTLGPIVNDAAAQQFAVVAANNNDYPVVVTVTKNAARVGEPLNEQAVASVTVPARGVQRIDLPQHEVDGAMGQNGTYTKNSGSGTFVSPHGYHIVSTGPVVVYQFNPIIQQYSNDASTLIPTTAIGFDYVIIGYNTANPCGNPQLPIESIPDHTAITILAAEDDTTVTVTPTHPIKASGGDSGFAIAMTAKGTPLTFKLSRYTVVNLESEQPNDGNVFACAMSGQNGDFTGSQIHADKPIVVFTSGERGIGFGGAENIVYPPDWDEQNDDTCCTDHLEEQLLPVTALGKEFAIARSPIRSTDPTWKEPDIVRVVATVDGTIVTTNLPAPNDSFTLDANQQRSFGATVGFGLKASNAVEVSTYLVSQHFVKSGYTGDPSQLLIPAAEQHRKDYVFLIPGTFDSNYIVLAKPVDAAIMVDGFPLAMQEFANCVTGPIGMVAGVAYDQVTCKAMEGRHTVSADKPFGLSVYGYYNVGSYAFVGGSDVKIINPIL
ncbi:MAG TPA: IgGFc-binding protein [Kofleriaceae bacterium]|nr:IgGFc-binding protein [Kofleriaceae bacterium]